MYKDIKSKDEIKVGMKIRQKYTLRYFTIEKISENYYTIRDKENKEVFNVDFNTIKNAHMKFVPNLAIPKNIEPEGTKTVFSKPEKARIYKFPGNEFVKIENITELIVRSSGTHRLKTQDGKYYIIPTGWLCIELEIDDWTV